MCAGSTHDPRLQKSGFHWTAMSRKLSLGDREASGGGAVWVLARDTVELQYRADRFGYDQTVCLFVQEQLVWSMECGNLSHGILRKAIESVLESHGWTAPDGYDDPPPLG